MNIKTKIYLFLLSLVVFTSCHKPQGTSVTDKDVTGKWQLIQLELASGKRGPASTLMSCEMNFSADGSYSAEVQMKNQQQSNSRTGTWSLSNSFLICHDSDSSTVVSQAWMEGYVLALKPQGNQDFIYLYKKIADQSTPASNGLGGSPSP